MIRHLQGRVIAKTESDIVLDVNGVGYGLWVSAHTIHKLDETAQQQFFVYTHVREQEITLYGFITVQERQMFELLISVSGIGPKAALNILSIADVGSLSSAILNKDTSILTNVSGIGKKTAEKVVIELQNKMDGFSVSDAKSATDDSNAVEALKSMGYSVGEARAALESVDQSVNDPSEKIKLALKSLGK